MNSSTKLTTKRLLPALILAALFSAPLAANAGASQYLVVVPLDSVGTSSSDIKLTLVAANLPVASVGEVYVQDMNVYLHIAGTSSYDPSLLSWSALSDLPDGFTLSKDGILSGTPNQAHEEGFTLDIQAAYRGKQVVQQFPITVMPITVALAGDSRNWSDGTYAKTCDQYLHPSSNYRYEGAVGSGLYRISPGGVIPFDVSCDMDSEGGGWTLIEYDKDLEFKAWIPLGGNLFQWMQRDFTLKQTSEQINAVRNESSMARQRYVGLCNGVVHYFYSLDSVFTEGVAFRYHTGVETNQGYKTYSPATIKIIQDGCKGNGGEGGRLATATIFDIENINLPVINIGTADNGNPNELFGSPLTQYPVRFR